MDVHDASRQYIASITAASLLLRSRHITSATASSPAVTRETDRFPRERALQLASKQFSRRRSSLLTTIENPEPVYLRRFAVILRATRHHTTTDETYTNPGDVAAYIATMPCKAEGLVLTVDPNVIHKVDTGNTQNLYSMWTGTSLPGSQ